MFRKLTFENQIVNSFTFMGQRFHNKIVKSKSQQLLKNIRFSKTFAHSENVQYWVACYETIKENAKMPQITKSIP